jgi:hypothetical protein
MRFRVGTHRSGRENTRRGTSYKYKRSGTHRSGTHRHGIADFLDRERRYVIAEVRGGGAGGGGHTPGFVVSDDIEPPRNCVRHCSTLLTVISKR